MGWNKYLCIPHIIGNYLITVIREHSQSICKGITDINIMSAKYGSV